MTDKVTPFVVNDRRKFNAEGELRPESERPHEEEAPVAQAAAPTPVEEPTPITEDTAEEDATPQAEMPKLTEEQISQARAAYEATAERLDVALRAANPGMEHPPAMSFNGLVQSVYMSTIMQLGGGTPDGEQARVDILGAKQSIDMLAMLQEKTKGNLIPGESQMLENAIFELRMAFLEITQALARQASRAQVDSPLPPPPGGGPRIVR